MSESRNSSESRGYNYTPSYSSESRYDSREQESRSRYNNLEDIDSLIEKLERENPTIQSNSPRINKALNQRKQKIEELKRLREEAKMAFEEEKQLRKLEQSNAELDEVIGKVKNLIRKPNSNYDHLGESHDSGESRW